MRFLPATLLRFVLALSLVGSATQTSAQEDPASRRAAIEALYPVMIAALEAKNFGRARNICEQALLWEPQNPLHHYNLACIDAQSGGPRLARAMSSLELAVALGFNDAEHMQRDPDLTPLHQDPKFAELVRKVSFNQTVGDVVGTLNIPPPKPEPASIGAAAGSAAGEPELPAPATFQQGAPVGVYFMTRYRPLTRTLEKMLWYFASDGTVYQNLGLGFSRADLAAHPGPRGKLSVAGSQLEIAWADGKKTVAALEREGTGFTWDMGIFTAVAPFSGPDEVAGVYEGGELLSGGGNVAVSRKFELRADGTFSWDNPSSVRGSSAAGTATGDGTMTGRWRLSGYSLLLTPEKGETVRQIAFPDDDEKTPLKPDRMFFDGRIYRRLP